LHRHSEFSRLDGIGTARQYARRAAELGQPALAQTDHGTLSGALHHIVACAGKDEKGKRIHDPIIPISGVEAYFRPDRRLAVKFRQRQAWHLCLFARNLKGWHNLLNIVSTAYADPKDGGGFYQYPCVDWELLERYKEGLAVSSACISSYLSTLVQDGHAASIREFVGRMLSIFGENFWIEIMPHDFEEQWRLNLALVDVAQEFSVPLIATNDAHFPFREWAETQRVAKLCGTKRSFKSVEIDKAKGRASYLADLHPTLYLASEDEMRTWFRKHHPGIPPSVVDESISNTVLFMQKIKFFMLDKTDKLPKVVNSKDEGEALLRSWIDEGWDRLCEEYPEDHWDRWSRQTYLDRIESEWKILKSKGVIDYFLLTGDVVRWCKSDAPLPDRSTWEKFRHEEGRKRPIRVGLGRGSAAGCLISYLVGIVAIDPISWGLLFERFLNPSRKGLPDIDLDFQRHRRHEVKEYISQQHGRDHVADIITHARFQPKSVLKALCRVHDIPFAESRAVTDTIEIRQDSEETTLEELLPLNEALRAFKNRYPQIWEHALRLEGTVENAGKHASGVIITPKPVADYMALERGTRGDLVTSWSDAADFPVVSDHGLVKIDALGLLGLEKHDHSLLAIERRHKKFIDLNRLPPLRNPYDVDDEVLEGFRKGWTIGIFQFGSRGITSLMRDISPSGAALDIAAANALYRPGPMKGGVTWDYPKRKRMAIQNDGHFDEWYWHEYVFPILSETYGLVCYQEQVMEISKQLGGFSGAEADDLRKAMGKLYRIKGGNAAKEFMKRFEERWFAGCVNREIPIDIAHEIWNKILEFGHYGFNKSHSASYALQAYQDMWLKVHYPIEFYAAFLTYEADDDKRMAAIREARGREIQILPPCINSSDIGWTADDNCIRMGIPSIKGLGDKGAAAIIKERAYGRFESIDDFRERVPAKSVNRRAQEALFESGALDCFEARRGVDERIIAAWEKARLNMSLTVPSGADRYAEVLKRNIYTQDEVASYMPGTTVIVGGEITRFEVKNTRRGSPFANVDLIFELNQYRVKFWSEALEENYSKLAEGNTIIVAGKIDEWNGFRSVVARDVTDDLQALEGKDASQPE
jgi:DNA polymerase-3 subunit alpha